MIEEVLQNDETITEDRRIEKEARADDASLRSKKRLPYAPVSSIPRLLPIWNTAKQRTVAFEVKP